MEHQEEDVEQELQQHPQVPEAQNMLLQLQRSILQLQRLEEMQQQGQEKMEAEKKDLLEQVKQLKQAELEAWRAALRRLIAFQQLEQDLAPRNENRTSLSHYRGCPSPCSRRHDAAAVRKF